ncbi:hypothetical protein SAMN05421505_16213 [Sinosporangium album]|uniref:Pycsar effector protein domain-containing protein n=1 Tax=Sinosporangium album TaxID=504805 RepID=A0A1G8L6V4_9ACTN|nr:Pycsar system effector family protein [Sinosporangium album]SDI51331.1 hypothetical protein SAMN05421505_16213 [Sinosporangium album]
MADIQTHIQERDHHLHRANHRASDSDAIQAIGHGIAVLGQQAEQARADAEAQAAIDSITAQMQAEVTGVRTELARVDAKAALLLAFAGTAFSVAAAAAVLAGSLSLLARIGIMAAAVLLAIATATTLSAVRPNLAPKSPGVGFLAYAQLEPAAILENVTESPAVRLAETVSRLSRITRAKYIRVRLAIDLLIAAVVIVAAALPFG